MPPAPAHDASCSRPQAIHSDLLGIFLTTLSSCPAFWELWTWAPMFLCSICYLYIQLRRRSFWPIKSMFSHKAFPFPPSSFPCRFWSISPQLSTDCTTQQGQFTMNDSSTDRSLGCGRKVKRLEMAHAENMEIPHRQHSYDQSRVSEILESFLIFVCEDRHKISI